MSPMTVLQNHVLQAVIYIYLFWVDQINRGLYQYLNITSILSALNINC